MINLRLCDLEKRDISDFGKSELIEMNYFNLANA